MNATGLAAIVVYSLLVVVLTALAISKGRSDIDRVTLTDLTDNDPHFDKVCDAGDLTQHFPTTGLVAESPLDIFEHTAMTVEFFPQLQAEEAS